MAGVEEPESLYRYDDRLVQFAGEVVFFYRGMKKDEVGIYYGNQLLRSSGSSSLNFGEAQGTITTKDFLNKMSIVVKELKESRNNLKVLNYIKEGDESKRKWLTDEVEELIAIGSKMINNKR
ncbi:MAG: four helix bundle protein [Flavobacteriales bacterium]|nr:four helix bundle protein [Flavobacteriales bacterium]